MCRHDYWEENARNVRCNVRKLSEYCLKRPGYLVQWIKCILYKPDDWSTNPENSSISQAGNMPPVSLAHERDRDWVFPGQNGYTV